MRLLNSCETKKNYPNKRSSAPPIQTSLKDINPLNPKEFDFESSEEIKTTISYLLKQLNEHIMQHINSRDLSLV